MAFSKETVLVEEEVSSLAGPLGIGSASFTDAQLVPEYRPIVQ